MPFNRALLERAAKQLDFAASLFLAFMMLFTTASLILRKFAGYTGEGDVDLMVLAFGASFFLALPAVTLRNDHVVVDMIDHFVGQRALKRMRWFGSVCVIVFLAVIFVTAIPNAIDKLVYGENTMSLNINRFWMWLPLLIGLGLATVAAVLHVIVDLIGDDDAEPTTRSSDGI